VLKAYLKRKIRLPAAPADDSDDGDDVGEADDLSGREDALTSAVFERLSYLEPSRAWALLRASTKPILGDSLPPLPPDGDTGWPDDASGEPDPATFRATDQCETELSIALWWSEAKDPDWETAWKKVERLSRWHDGEPHEVRVEKHRYRHTLRAAKLVELVDEDAVRARVVEPIRSWLATLT
jgi:hypothetical protein